MTGDNIDTVKYLFFVGIYFLDLPQKNIRGN